MEAVKMFKDAVIRVSHSILSFSSSQVHAGLRRHAWFQAVRLLLLHVEVHFAHYSGSTHRRDCYRDGLQPCRLQRLGRVRGQSLFQICPCLGGNETSGHASVPSELFQGAERFQNYSPWALAMAYSLIVVAMLPLPLVYIARRFNFISDGSNKLSVSYRKGMMKDMSNLEEQDEQRFILGKNPGDTPSPMPAHRAYLGPGGTQEMTNTNYGTSTKTGYQNIGSPESEL